MNNAKATERQKIYTAWTHQGELLEKSILIPNFMHGIYDYMCFVTDPTLESGIMANDIAMSALIPIVLVDVIAGIWGLYLLRPAKRAEIHAIWNDKWSVNKGE